MAKSKDDFFANTSMSFGEHLEELRVCLFRAVIGLFIGFLLGLLLAEHVVSWIKSPLTNALEKYYVAKSIDVVEAEYKAKLSPSMQSFMTENRFIFEEIYVEASAAKRFQQQVAEAPDAIDAIVPPTDGKDKPDAVDTDTSDAKEAGDGEPEAPEMMVIGDPLPLPTNVVVKTRVWRPINTFVKALNAHEVFMIWLKAAFISGLILSSPWIFYQIWSFVAAGLYPHEKQYVHIFLPFSLVLFLAGAGTAFFFVFEPVLNFLFSFNKTMNIDPDPRISEWLSFVLFLPLGFGLAFQLPLVMLFLERIGLFTMKVYLEKWRIAILIIFILSMLLTPADPISMLLMACPLTVLYFLGILLCRFMPRNRNPFGDSVYEP